MVPSGHWLGSGGVYSGGKARKDSITVRTCKSNAERGLTS